ncbi:MAG: glycosyltransferase family 9 protein [Thermodesulfovibrio sp.]|nr:glycosyltransferase family 9 protein [Thermodesulfovibrio sp.]
MKALVYRMAGLGDSLLVYPVLEILKRKGYEVTVWGNTEYFRLAEILGFCTKSVFYEPKEDYDLKIIFSKDTEILKSFKKNSIYINPIPKEKIWIVDYYLRKLGFENERFSKTLPLPFSEIKDSSLCIVHPGSGSKKKNPDLVFFFKLEEILKDAGFNVFYLIGPAERELINIFKNSVYLENPVEIAKFLLKANLYIGFDSGVSHLSSYLGVHSVIVFGPTEPKVWHPIGESFHIIRYEKCPPCFPEVCEERKCLDPDFLIDRIKILQICQKV